MLTRGNWCVKSKIRSANDFIFKNKLGKISFIEWCLQNYYIDRNPISFSNHKFLIDLYLDENANTVIKKSAQCGVSEYAIALSMYFASVLDATVLYLFPTQKHVGDFVQQRCDPAINSSPLLQSLSSKTKGIKVTNKVGLKKINNGFIYYRGMKSEVDLISVPADILFVDEFDQCDIQNLPLAEERLAASHLRWKRKFSTPIFVGGPIDKEYESSDKRVWMIQCKHCNQFQHLDWYKHFVKEYKGLDIQGSKFLTYIPRDDKFDIETFEALAGPNWEDTNKIMPHDLRPICQYCNKPLERLSDGEWTSEYPSREKHGWHITRLYSPTKSVASLYHDFMDAQNSVSKIANFHRMALGEAYDSIGDGFSRGTLELIAANYDPLNFWDYDEDCVTTCGVDVGAMFHIQVSRRINGVRYLFYKNAVKDKQDVFEILRRFNVTICVIDVMPETRIAKEIREMMPHGIVYVANFGMNCAGQANDETDWLKIDHAVCALKCDRTITFDEAMNAMTNINPTCIFPAEFLSDENWVKQMCAPKRQIITQELTGKIRTVWSEGSDPDHFRLADIYDFLAERVFLNREGNIYIPHVIYDDKAEVMYETFGTKTEEQRMRDSLLKQKIIHERYDFTEKITRY